MKTCAATDQATFATDKLRSVDDLSRNESACLACCRDKELDILLAERGIGEGTPLRLCWRAPMGDVLCVEAYASRFSFRRAEARSMLLHD